jgi:hypothetical protein
MCCVRKKAVFYPFRILEKFAGLLLNCSFQISLIFVNNAAQNAGDKQRQKSERQTERRLLYFLKDTESVQGKKYSGLNG